MSVKDSNIFKNVKNLYFRATYSEKYGGSIFASVFIIVIFLWLVGYYNIINTSDSIREDWVNQRCSPRVIPFAGVVNAPAGKSTFEYTAENFTFCVNNIVEDMAGMATMPITWATSIITNTIKLLFAALQKIRGLLDYLRLMLMKIISDIYQKILTFVIPLQKFFINIIDLFNKLNGILQTTLGQAEGAYNILASSIGAIYEFIVIILLALAAVVIILWLIPITWGAAAAMTAIFIAIMIPLAIIAVYMDIIFGLSGSRIPSVPSCFDEDTILVDENNNKIKIKNIKLGTRLFDGSIITSKMEMRSRGHVMYNLKNIFVSGNHRILYKSKLIKVKDHPLSKKTIYNKPAIYCLNTSTKNIKIQDMVFTDYDDLDNDEINELKYMFSDSNLKTDDLHSKYEGGFHKNTQVQLKNGDVKTISEIQINDILKNGELVLGLIEIDGKNIDMYKYYLHNLEIIAGKNLNFYDSNLGIIRNMGFNLIKEPYNKKCDKLYSIVTNNGLFSIEQYKFYDYNGTLDSYLKRENIKIIKSIFK